MKLEYCYVCLRMQATDVCEDCKKPICDEHYHAGLCVKCAEEQEREATEGTITIPHDGEEVTK